jgi:hypothetical protein
VVEVNNHLVLSTALFVNTTNAFTDVGLKRCDWSYIE